MVARIPPVFRIVPAFFAVILVTGCVRGSEVPAYQFDWLTAARYLPILLEGLKLSIALTVVNLITGFTLGVFVAMARLSRFRILQWLTIAYIEFFRGTPLLVQIIWAYFALPIVLGISLAPFVAVSTALTLNVGAFSAEAFRSGIQAVPREHTESAAILGLSFGQRMRYIVLPQAIRIVLPVLISYAIGLFKDTSLVSFVGVNDLMFNGTSVATNTYRPLEILTTVALLYFCVAFPLTVLMRRVERYLGRHRAQ